MKKFDFVSKLSLVLAFLLLVAAVSAGCGEKQDAIDGTVVTDAAVLREQIGEGEYSFDFSAYTLEGEHFDYTVATDCETVGDALVSLGLIDGENGAYGLYVKSVCGVVADYNIDATYWALYTDGEMSIVGADGVKCSEVSLVEFKVEK